ncbi:alpha/beta fold hydrolase [Fictibacillus sp. NRS-1165]|uniref:alpha/beta fold hydrolase n=1 Tax=Fictibacillus sp. NRS-1165 TaxID=3144463 RepID=UPI003D23D792
MELINGEYTILLNGINHWMKIDGSQNKTIPLIIIHRGPGGNHYTFERTVGPLLAKKRTIVYYEQRGCGRSDKPQCDDDYTMESLIRDFIELKKSLGVDRVDLLGYSFGGELALEFSVAFPEIINNIILSGPSLMDSEIQKMVQITGFMSVANKDLYNKILLLQKESTSIADVYEKLWELVDTETVDLLLFENQEIAKINRSLWEESNLINTGLMMNVLENTPCKFPLQYRLKDLKQPTLIITGVFDRNTGVNISKIIHRELTNSTLELFDNSAHFPDLEETEKFINVVLEFLKS